MDFLRGKKKFNFLELEKKKIWREKKKKFNLLRPFSNLLNSDVWWNKTFFLALLSSPFSTALHICDRLQIRECLVRASEISVENSLLIERSHT
jgi:hypothetical protein